MFQGCPTMQRLAAVNGLVALVGSESYLIQVRSPPPQTPPPPNLTCIVDESKKKSTVDKQMLLTCMRDRHLQAFFTKTLRHVNVRKELL